MLPKATLRLRRSPGGTSFKGTAAGQRGPGRARPQHSGTCQGDPALKGHLPASQNCSSWSSGCKRRTQVHDQNLPLVDLRDESRPRAPRDPVRRQPPTPPLTPVSSPRGTRIRERQKPPTSKQLPVPPGHCADFCQDPWLHQAVPSPLPQGHANSLLPTTQGTDPASCLPSASNKAPSAGSQSAGLYARGP